MNLFKFGMAYSKGCYGTKTDPEIAELKTKNSCTYKRFCSPIEMMASILEEIL